MASMIKKLGLNGADRSVAMQGVSLLAKARSAAPAGLYATDETGKQIAVEMTSKVLNTLHTVLEQVARHDEVLLINPEAELSPEQAAKILRISRPMVYQRMDGGRMPYREIGSHRRVLMADVLKLKKFEDRRRKFARRLAEDTENPEAMADGRRGEGVTPSVSRALDMFVERTNDAYGSRLAGIVLFGSRARREGRHDSDVDVAVVLDCIGDPGIEQNRLSDITYDVLVDTGEDVQPWPVSRAEWDEPEKSANPTLIRAMKRDGVNLTVNHDRRAVFESGKV